MKVLAVIPARYSSVRFPGKPLAQLKGKTMIQRVWERASQAVDDIVIATDDRSIYDEALRFGARAVMTSDSLQSGTERCAAAVRLLESDADIVVNIQGDEPLIDPDDIRLVVNTLKDSDAHISTLAHHFHPAEGYARLASPDRVKVVLNARGEALLFSRSVIPFYRDAPTVDWPDAHQYLIHTGLYAFRRRTLEEIAGLHTSALDHAEHLEQLRWLYNGYRIRVAITHNDPLSVDTPADADRVRAILKKEDE